MKLIKQTFEILEQQPGIEGMYKQIELAGRTCYSPDTEVLTDSGWKRIDNLFAIDKVVSYNPIDNTIIYDNPNLIVKDYEDDIIEIDHPQIKICVTKDHRIYQSIPQKRDYAFLTASQLAGIEKIPQSKQCRFRIPKYFNGAKRNINTHIPSIVYSKEIKHGNRKSSMVTVSIPCNKDFMVIAGAFIAEGHTFHGEKYGTGSYCQITQDEGSELYSKVVTALTHLNWNYKIEQDPRKHNIKWIKFGTNQCWVMAFDDLFGKGSRNKHLPIWFRDLPDEFLKILLSTMYLGDGSHSTTRHERYLSISQRLLDEVQETHILLGVNGSTHFNNKVSQACYFEKSHRDSWIISRNKHIKTRPYNGKVYCTSTKSGIICVRYKGKTCWCGNCYKSEDKITEDSAKEFVDRMINSGHWAMLEHGTVYLDIPNSAGNYELVPFFASNPYSKLVVVSLEDRIHNYITTNLRVIVENFAGECIPDIFQYWCEPTEYHEKRYTVKWIIDRVTGESFLRHRVFSFARESTRYCNYSKDKFDNEIKYILPNWVDEKQLGHHDSDKLIKEGKEFKNWAENEELSELYFLLSLAMAEKSYFNLLNSGWKPQQARQVLPFSVSSPLVMTGFASYWPHFFNLRCDSHAHPQAREIATALREEFVKRGYVFAIKSKSRQDATTNKNE